MTREEHLYWLNKEIETWENECQSKHPVKEALYAARKALKQEPTLEKDGTLIVTTEHYKNVGRVLVQCGTNGALFYQDQEPTTKNDIRDNRVKDELNRVKDELEPTTKNNLRVDCISRKSVIAIIQNHWWNCRDIDKLVNELPSAIPKGHWIKEESIYGWDGHSYQCSECGRSIHLDPEMEDLEDYPYCHCGAKMQDDMTELTIEDLEALEQEQDKRIRGYGGKWTLYRNNARWFNSKEEAVKVCKQFRYNNAKVTKA